MSGSRKSRHDVGRYMTPAPHSIGVEQSLETAHRMMKELGIRHLPVLEGGKLVGLLSQRDLYLTEALEPMDTRAVRVDQAMSQDTYVVEKDALLDVVAATMAERKLGCAVVVDHAKVVGVLTTTDALHALVTVLRATKEGEAHP
jgi:acetoin utilization protein AcuB